MNTNVTQQDILRYIYKETSDQETASIEAFINKDRAAKLFFLETKDTLKKLDELSFSPEETSVNIIMESISKSTRFEETL